MPILSASLATSFLITFFLIPVIINVVKKKKILDEPGRRKIHKRETPSMGGIGIFFGLMISILIWMPFEGFARFKFMYGAIIIMSITGVRDDLLPLKPLYKLIGQVIAASMVIYLSGIRLGSFYGLFGVQELHPFISYILTLFTIIVITNSFNLIDGLDGLAGSIASVALLTFGVYFFLVDDDLIAVMIFSMIGSLLAFLNFNWEPSKIFMGDTGALLVGFVLSITTIYFIEFNYNLDGESPYKFEASISTAICFLIMPLFDTLRVFISRALRGKSPFAPDKTHIHHLLMRLGLRHSGSVIVMVIVNLLFIGIAVLSIQLSDNMLLPIVIFTALTLSFLLDYLISRKFPKKIQARKS